MNTSKDIAERCGVDGCVLDKGHPGSVHNTTEALVEMARACAVDLRRVGRPTAADGVEAIAKEVMRLQDERARGTAALRAAFGEDLWALGHPAYVVNHMRQEYAKLERLWKQACVERDARLHSETQPSVDGLLSCRFCHSTRVQVVRSFIDGDSSIVHCPQCDACGPRALSTEPEGTAAARWNAAHIAETPSPPAFFKYSCWNNHEAVAYNADRCPVCVVLTGLAAVHEAERRRDGKETPVSRCHFRAFGTMPCQLPGGHEGPHSCGDSAEAQWESAKEAMTGDSKKAAAPLPACECLVRDKEPSAYHHANCPRFVADLL